MNKVVSMKIYTTYFANVRNLPDEVVPIAICGKPIFNWIYPAYKKLAPKWSFFSVWQKTRDNDYYIEHFHEEVLWKLDPHTVVNELSEISEGKDCALVCYEAPDKFCHRHLVADWLNSAGYDVNEFGVDDEKA